MTTYTTKTFERNIGGKMVLIVSLTPKFSVDEKKATELAIERRLYDVFCKYTPPKH